MCAAFRISNSIGAEYRRAVGGGQAAHGEAGGRASRTTDRDYSFSQRPTTVGMVSGGCRGGGEGGDEILLKKK